MTSHLNDRLGGIGSKMTAPWYQRNDPPSIFIRNLKVAGHLDDIYLDYGHIEILNFFEFSRNHANYYFPCFFCSKLLHNGFRRASSGIMKGSRRLQKDKGSIEGTEIQTWI